MRNLKIILLQFQEVIEDRSRIFVWFLLGIITPLIMILFWRGASHIPGWTSNEITSYYLLAIIINAIIMCQQEEHVGTIDIQEGGLSSYLLKPFSYFWLIFFNELAYRLLQGILGILLLVVFVGFFPGLFAFAKSPDVLFLSVIIAIVAFLLTFIFKMIIGILAFWLTETRGAFEATNVMIVIFSGLLMPLAFLPSWLEQIVSKMPFAYMIYFPVIAFEGKLTVLELWQVLFMEFFWLGICLLIYKKLWQEGIKQYTAVGQ